MSGAVHGRKSPGFGRVRKVRLVTGEARYQAYVGGRYVSTHETRAEAEEAVRKESEKVSQDTTAA